MKPKKLFTITMELDEDLEIYNIVAKNIETATHAAYNMFAEYLLLEDEEDDKSFRFKMADKVQELKESHCLREVLVEKVTVLVEE